MPGYQGELPAPESTGDEKVLSDIREFGWHCLRVAPLADTPATPAPSDGFPPDSFFAYTVGVWLTFEHPEIILVGPWSSWHGILNGVVELVRQGHRFSAGTESNEVLDDYPVRFGAVDDQRRRSLLTFSDWVSFRRGFDAVQLILPDGHSRFPDEPDYASFEQPMLA